VTGSSSQDKLIDESLQLVRAFMKVRDIKARAEILRLAERCAWFSDRPAILDLLDSKTHTLGVSNAVSSS
jgi:hypothetical protein